MIRVPSSDIPRGWRITMILAAIGCAVAVLAIRGCRLGRAPLQHQWGFHLAAGEGWNQAHDVALRLGGVDYPLPVLVRTEAPVEVLQQDERGLRVRFGDQLAELVIGPQPAGPGSVTHWVRDQPGRRSIQQLAFWVISPDGSWPRTKAFAHNEMWALLPFCNVVDLDARGAFKSSAAAERAARK